MVGALSLLPPTASSGPPLLPARQPRRHSLGRGGGGGSSRLGRAGGGGGGGGTGVTNSDLSLTKTITNPPFPATPAAPPGPPPPPRSHLGVSSLARCPASPRPRAPAIRRRREAGLPASCPPRRGPPAADTGPAPRPLWRQILRYHVHRLLGRNLQG